MLKKDHGSCNLFKTQIYDDLVSFYLFYQGGLKCRFGNTAPRSLTSNKLGEMTALISSASEEEVWTPAFVQASVGTSAPYLEGTLNRKPVLGFNEFFVLDSPVFKTISTQNNVKVGIDWFLNDVLNTDIVPYKGVLFWYKKRSSIRQNTAPLNDISIGEWIYSSADFIFKTATNKQITIPAGQVCVKLNNFELQVLPYNKIANTNNELLRYIRLDNALGSQNNTYEPTKIDLSKCVTIPSIWTRYDDLHYLNVNGSYYSIHISEGDYFSYYDKDNNLQDFLSFNLMHIYRTIYNNLLNITNLSSVSGNQAKNLRKLAFVLATGPQNDKVTLNINGTYGTVNYVSTISSYINADTPSDSDLISICQNVYREIKFLEINRYYNTSLIPYKVNLVDIGPDFCKVPNDILHRLVSKYGMYMRFAGDDAKITIDKILAWKEFNNSSNLVGGPNISIDSRYIYWTNSRDISGEANYRPSPGSVGHQYYDQHIQAGPMRIETDIANQLVYFKSIDSADATVKAGLIKASQNPRIDTSSSSYLLLPEIKYSMFYKQGGFKIVSSTCYIDEPVGQQSMYNGKLDTKPIFLKIDKLSTRWNSGSNKAYDYQTTDTDEYKKPSLKFKLYNSNDVIKLDSLYINFLRYKQETLCQCESFYKEIINRSQNYTKEIGVNRFLGLDIFEQTPKTVGYGRAGYCDMVYLGKVKNLVAGVEIEELASANVPGVSTRFSPPILAYGGYDGSIVSELGIKLPSHPMPGEKMPILETRNPNYTEEVKCYERTGLVQDGSYFSHTDDKTNSDNLIGTTPFEKGFFHPHYGWIQPGHSKYNSFKNKTAVVSYKPKNKSRFVFKGVGFLFDTTYSSYSSTISINRGSDKKTVDEVNPQTSIRDASSFISKFSSEYICDECIPYRGKKDSSGNFLDNNEKLRDNDCNNNYQPKINYAIYPLTDGTTSTVITSQSDIDNLRIKDIEIKLNFVNFDNIQDIKLTLKYTGGNPEAAPSSYYGLVSSTPFPSAETNLNSYITALQNTNPSDTIILLNKEHIKQYGSEFVLRFSDYASPFTMPNPLNKTENNEINFSSLLNTSSADGEALLPSFKPDGYSDKDAQYYREILNSYNVCIINNKFRKWYGSPLVNSKFVLEVELANKYNKGNYGNIPDLHIKNNRDTDLLKSNIARNSICNWEIIIDTFSTTDPDHRKKQKINISHPAAEHIDYTRTIPKLLDNASSYPEGYNYIGDFTGRKFMVPPVNMNAPHQYLTDFNSCVYPDRTYNNFGFSRAEDSSLRYIYQAFNLFSAGIGAAAGFAAAGGMTGAFVGGTLFGMASSLAVSSVVSFFNNLRRTRLVDAYDNSFYDPYYDDYGYGIPDRALVEVSSDNGYTWYTFDAKIFKYNRYCSPIYKPLKVSYTGAGGISDTSCSRLSSSIVPDSPSDSTPIKADPSTFDMPGSLIFTGNYIQANELNIRKNIRLLSDRANISNYSNLIIGSNTYDKDSTVCIEIPHIKAFHYLKSGILSISTPVDIIYYDPAISYYRNKVTKTLSNIAVLNKDNKYNTYLLFNDVSLKRTLDKNLNAKVIVQKSSAEQKLGIILSKDQEYLTLSRIKELYENVFAPDYIMPVYGEGAWGRGSSSTELLPAKKITFPNDCNLSDFAIGFSHNRYVGRINTTGSTIVSTDLLNIGLFDNMNGWPLYKNVEKFNLYNTLNDNIHYPYKNISDLNSIFYLYTNTEVEGLKNMNLSKQGVITLLDHLIPQPVADDEKIDLAGCKVEAIYSDNEIEGSTCYGGHYCDRAKFNVSINGIFLFVANLNNGYNEGGRTGSPPSPPLDNGVGSSDGDRYSYHIITDEQAARIQAANPDNISISYSPTADNPNPHSNITWIRVLNPQGEEITSTCAAQSSVGSKVLPYNDNKYWISIDKHQYGTYSRTTTIKVLDKIEYSCSEPRTVPGGLNCKNICGISRNYGSSIGVGDDTGVTWEPIITTPIELMKVQAKSTAFDQIIAEASTPATAIFTNKQADAHKAAIATKFPQIQWEKIVFSRPDVRVSCANSNGDTLMFIKEHYWIAKNINAVSDGYGGIMVKASSILDTNDNILVRFKHNTRKLRHVDNFLKKYIISPNGSITYGGIGGTDELPIKNSFYSWFCNYVNRGTNTLNTVVPPYYMMLNEMIFRGFFGSKDGLEIKSSTSKTQYPHEWIPYEYDNSISCNNSDFKDNVFISGLHDPDKLGFKLRCWLLSKLVTTPYDKKKIVSRCLAYMDSLGGPGIVPEKRVFDALYKINDPMIDTLRNTFMG